MAPWEPRQHVLLLLRAVLLLLLLLRVCVWALKSRWLLVPVTVATWGYATLVSGVTRKPDLLAVPEG